MTTPLSNQAEQDVATQIKKCADQLLCSMNFSDLKIDCQVKEVNEENGSSRRYAQVNIEAGDTGRMLIGVRGNNLEALRHVLRSVIRRQVDSPIHIMVDVNSYLASRERSLLHQAEEGARKAVRTGQAVVLPPMSSAQRRLIHSSLASRQEIYTESMGNEPNRRVIIRPTFI